MANYHILKIDSLLESLTLCNTSAGFRFQLSIADEISAAPNDLILGYINSPIDEVRYIFEVESISSDAITLLKKCEVSKGPNLDLSSIAELQPVAYMKDYMTITEETFESVVSTILGISLGYNNPKTSVSTTSVSQTIYYGCPGTGKSFTVKKDTEGEYGEKTIWYDKSGARVESPSEEEKKTLSNNIFRTTFHPDYDYATFVGCYKPGKDVDGRLDYRFVPQVFTNAYVTALRHPEDPVYLIIEEINRGNCAQIFGDLFQLLDRTDGVSDFAIKPDTELSNYLSGEGVPSDSLRLPANLHIYATMNTSDQSLFPMDSAFKRRWSMEYMPINYEHPIASKYTVTIAGRTFRWLDFLKWANFQIRESTSSEDKQMGEFFIRCGSGKNIAEKEFVNKVMFYIWNDICKDYYNPRHVTKQFFMRLKTKQENELDYFTFAELFDKKRNEGSRLLLGFMEYIEAAYKEKHPDEAASADGTPSEPSASSPAVEAQ